MRLPILAPTTAARTTANVWLVLTVTRLADTSVNALAAGKERTAICARADPWVGGATARLRRPLHRLPRPIIARTIFSKSTRRAGWKPKRIA